MANDLFIDLKLCDDSFKALAHLKLDSGEKELSFLINDGVDICSVTSPDSGVSFSETEKLKPTFRPLCKKLSSRSTAPFPTFPSSMAAVRKA